MKPIRQGDVILLPTSKVLGDELPHLTLVEGISTGHSHRISKGIARLFSHQGELYLQVRSRLAVLSHDEHRPLKVHHGNWKVYVQREYVPQKNGKFLGQIEQEFIADDDSDEEFLKGFVKGVKASSKEQLVADVLTYNDDGISTSLATKSSSQKGVNIQQQSKGKAARPKSLSNWKYVVD
ncbi:MAG: hypothetical protein KTR27_11810 [Leptolyngbyaceae cyanobacterium MAG.088]|nr:hypothetical protein [Leptolyngbyaceae cyanobacterium MAG.088]